MNARKLTGTLVLAIAGASVGILGCSGQGSEVDSGDTEVQPAASVTASATLTPTEGSTVSGSVTFAQTSEGVSVFAQLNGLEPGEHGFHVHQNGDCSAGDGSSAGGHFNPTGMPHGSPDDEQHHIGDLGNILADEGGNAVLERLYPDLSLTDPVTTIVGRAVIVHATADDMTSQPSGAAGARLACGVIVQTQ